MKVLFVFAHPAPYKIDLFNGLAPHVDLTVVFERHASGFRHPYFYDRTRYDFRTIFLRGLSLGAENHLSFELIRHLKSNHYDLIVMNGYSSLTEILTIRYLQRKKRPYVLYVNGGVIHEDPQWRYRLKTKLVSGLVIILLQHHTLILISFIMVRAKNKSFTTLMRPYLTKTSLKKKYHQKQNLIFGKILKLKKVRSSSVPANLWTVKTISVY